MAITQCPSCQKRISSNAELCPHCHADTSGDDQQETARQRGLHRRKLNNMNIQLSLAMTLLVISVGFMVLEMSQGKHFPSPWYIGTSLASAVWYVFTRLRIFLSRY